MRNRLKRNFVKMKKNGCEKKISRNDFSFSLETIVAAVKKGVHINCAVQHFALKTDQNIKKRIYHKIP